MPARIKKSKSIFVLWVIALTMFGVAGAVAIKSNQQRTGLPRTISKVKNLEVVSVTLENEGQPDATAVIEVHNNSYKAVVAVAIESGDGINSSGINKNGFIDDDPPQTVIEPFGVLTMRMPLSNLIPNTPLRVSGIFYEDGTEEGEDNTLKTMRSQRDHERKKGAAKKGTSQP